MKRKASTALLLALLLVIAAIAPAMAQPAEEIWVSSQVECDSEDTFSVLLWLENEGDADGTVIVHVPGVDDPVEIEVPAGDEVIDVFEGLPAGSELEVVVEGFSEFIDDEFVDYGACVEEEATEEEDDSEVEAAEDEEAEEEVTEEEVEEVESTADTQPQLPETGTSTLLLVLLGLALASLGGLALRRAGSSAA